MNHPNHKRVLVVGEFGIINGGENSFLAIALRLIELGWEIHAAVPPDSEFARALESIEIHVHPWSVHEIDGTRKSQDCVRKELALLITETRPEILHFNSLSTSRLGGPVARELGVPSLGYLRDIMKLSKKAIADINRVDRLIAVSNATKDWHDQQGMDCEKLFVVHNGVDTSTFCPTGETTPTDENRRSIREELSIPANAEVLLFVGQIGIRKGVELLVNSFLTMAEYRPDLHLLIVGQRHSTKQEAIDYENKIINSANSSPYSRRVHWLGRRPDVAAIMRESTILVHPARQEPLGRVLLEAAASGLPIVTTRVGGSSEILAGPLGNWLTTPDDPTELIAKLIELLDNPNLLARLGLQLRSRVIECFSIEKCLRLIDSHYNDLRRER